MRKKIYFILIFALIVGCKKEKELSNNPVSTPFFSDTSSNKPTGLDTSSSLELQLIPNIEDIDTSLLPYFGRVTSPSTWGIDVPPVGTQLYNSCVGWAIGHGMLGYQYKVIEGHSDYMGLNRIFSAAYIWNQLNNGENRGISIVRGLNLIKNQGCCKWIDMPSNIPSFTVQPSAIAIQNASNYKLSQFFKFRTVDIDNIKFLISRNYPIPFGAEIDNGFMTGTDLNSFNELPDGRLIWKQKSGVKKGGHAMLICGYDDNINAFKVLNSWGTDWGNRGFIWIDYNFFKTIIIKNVFLNQPEIYVGISQAVVDPDGNLYHTTTIGTQVWMAENLRTTRYRNGDQIPNITDANDWANLTNGAYCDYDNSPINSITYGRLYNWFAVNDSRNIAPIGWHVASEAEWNILETFLGGSNIAGGKLKEVGITHWMTPNFGATNSSGFNGLPGGTRSLLGDFSSLNTNGNWWTTSIWPGNGIYYKGLRYPAEDVLTWYHQSKSGMSVRCIKD